MAIRGGSRTSSFSDVLPASQVLVHTPVTAVEVNVIHEPDIHGAGLTFEESRVIPPSAFPTLVTFKSKVGASASEPPSNEYFATVRRRKAKNIQASIAGLVKYAERDDFTAWTFPVIQQIKGLLDFLLDAEREGNTREILRQLRDSFMNEGWNNYRREEARILACKILANLASAEEILPEHVNAAFDRLIGVGLGQVPAFAFAPEADDEVTDGEEEEVLD
jgi:hypothetical protein